MERLSSSLHLLDVSGEVVGEEGRREGEAKKSTEWAERRKSPVLELAVFILLQSMDISPDQLLNIHLSF